MRFSISDLRLFCHCEEREAVATKQSPIGDETRFLDGGLLKRPTKTPPPECGTNAFTCSMEVENFDATANKILQNGGTVALPKFAVPGTCWQGYFIDIDGNKFGIFQVDANAK